MISDSRWYKIDVITKPCAVDLISQLLIALGCKGSVIQPDDATTVVSGYVPCDGRMNDWNRSMQERIETAQSYGLVGNETRVSIAEVEGEDWAESWKVHFRPI